MKPWHGGHLLCSKGSANLSVEAVKAVGRAPAGSTRPGPGSSMNERAVHALRQLERELIQRLATRLGDGTKGDLEAEVVDVAWLLHNGKIRRRIGAVVRFHPVAELFVQTAGPEPDMEEPVDDTSALPQRRSSACPQCLVLKGKKSAKAWRPCSLGIWDSGLAWFLKPDPIQSLM